MNRFFGVNKIEVAEGNVACKTKVSLSPPPPPIRSPQFHFVQHDFNNQHTISIK